MAAKSDIEGIEKGHQHIARSSSDKSVEGGVKEIYNAKTSVSGKVQGTNLAGDTSSSDSMKEVFDIGAIDPVLSKKMALVNTAIDEIGMTSFQWKMFLLNGFGYAVDSVC